MIVGVVGIAVQTAKGAVVQHVPVPVEPLVQAAVQLVALHIAIHLIAQGDV